MRNWRRSCTAGEGRSASATYPLLRRFLAQQHTLGYARASVARKVGSIHTFYRWALAAGRVADDPSLLLGRPKVVNRLPTVLRAGEAAALAEAPAAGASPTMTPTCGRSTEPSRCATSRRSS